MNTLDRKTIETIRFLSVDAINAANSGHPGLPMGTATMAFALWKEFLKGSSKNAQWMDRDRFVLSAGHGSMLLYSLLNLFGYDLSLEDIKQFRQMGSKTPGHPEFGMTEGVEMTTGPLGQGISTAVGMAIAERRMAAQFDLIDHYTYVLAGDGDLMEGISSEASSLAGHLGLGKMIVMYDSNKITIDGSTDITFTEDVAMRYRAYGWQVLEVADGNDYEAIVKAIEEARKVTDQPSMIVVQTVIGFGSPKVAGKSAAHGSPLGEDEAKVTKAQFGWDPDQKFVVPQEVTEHMVGIKLEKEKALDEWTIRFDKQYKEDSAFATMWDQWMNFEVPEEILEDEQLWNDMSVKDATRSFGGKMVNRIAECVPNIVGGSADLNGSTKTYMKNFSDFTKENPGGNNLFFGVREHAMAAIMNGISLHGGFRVFGATFLSFADYMKPSIRLAALMKQPVIYIFTHDSIGVGEDGPTHQPIEQVLMLRSIPDLKVFRPADGKETAIAMVEALKYNGPSALILTRQKLPGLEGVGKAAHYGGYVLSAEQGDDPKAIIMATGSEVQLALEAQKQLWDDGVDTRVVSMMSWTHFDQQNPDYRKQVLPPAVRKRISIEALTTMGWHKYVGFDGLAIGLDRFGESAPAEELFDAFGFTAEKVVAQIKEYMK
jgi:transketolase